MKTLTLTLAFLSTALALAHGGVELALDQTTPYSAGKVQLSFLLKDGHGAEITDQDMVISHEKLLHFLAFDASMTEFRHAHPAYSAGRWRVELDLPVDGRYHLAADGKLGDGDNLHAASKLEVKGGLSAHAIPAELGDHRVGVNGRSRITLSSTVFRAGRSAAPRLTITRTDGTEPEISPFLGAPAHVTGAALETGATVHIHPVATAPDATELLMHLVFPKAGDYRMWIELVDGGEYKLVPLSVTVQP